MNESSSSDTEEGTSSSNQSKSMVDGMEDGEDETDSDLINEADRKPYLFTFHLVNSNGSSTVDAIRNDGSAIKFSSRLFLREFRIIHIKNISKVHHLSNLSLAFIVVFNLKSAFCWYL